MHVHGRLASLLSTALPLDISILHHLHHHPHTVSKIKSETWSATVQLPLSMDTTSQNQIYGKSLGRPQTDILMAGGGVQKGTTCQKNTLSTEGLMSETLL